MERHSRHDPCKENDAQSQGVAEVAVDEAAVDPVLQAPRPRKLVVSRREHHLAMGQKPVPPVNIPIPTKIDSKMGGIISFDPQPFL